MCDLLPYTFEEALKKLGSNFDYSKLLDHIANGDLKVCVRYDGVLGYLKSYIHLFHSKLHADQLASEIEGTFEFHGWLVLETGSEEFNQLLYVPQKSYSICSSNAAIPEPKSLRCYDFVLLDIDRDLYFFDKNLATANLNYKSIYLHDLRITRQSFDDFINTISVKNTEYEELLEQFQNLQEAYAKLEGDLLKGKSKKSYDQLIYLLCNYPKIVDLNEKPYSNYKNLIQYFDISGIGVNAPSDDTTVKILMSAKAEFENNYPK